MNRPVAARVPAGSFPRRDPQARFGLGPADRPLVGVGQRVAPGDPLVERVRDAELAELVVPAGAEPPAAGALVDRGVPVFAGHAGHFEGSGRALYLAPGGRLRAAVGRHAALLRAPVGGVVTDLDAAGLTMRADGLGLPGAVALGEPSRGLLRLAVERPDGELPSAAVDVDAVGTILVAGARTDVEALSRARAIGVRGVIVGGLVSRDLRGFAASERRQRASWQGAAPFGLLVLDGYGRRPIAGPVWEALVAAEGREVAILNEPPMVVLDPAAVIPAVAADRVRVAAGELLGREGRLLGWAGRRRAAAGVRLPMAWVRLDPREDGEEAQDRLLPVADLERLA